MFCSLLFCFISRFFYLITGSPDTRVLSFSWQTEIVQISLLELWFCEIQNVGNEGMFNHSCLTMLKRN